MGEIQQIEHVPAVAKRPRGTPASRKDDGAILSLIERAARDPGVDIDKMERLMAMQERMVAQRAQVAFAGAFAAMQAELPSIAENGTLEIRKEGRLLQSSRYALWEDINDAIKPVLALHGFGLRFEVGRSGDRLTVTGVLMHREGHSERTVMELPADTSGSKNAVQAIGSSTSYGKRYVAAALLNLTSRLRDDRDDDGASGGGSARITEEQEAELFSFLQKSGASLTKLLGVLKVKALGDLPATRFDDAVKILVDYQRRKGVRP